jgi:hypothetical protein
MATLVVFTGYLASDLGGAYYTANAPIVDLQIAKVSEPVSQSLSPVFVD